jgi:hypothetical protein
MLSCRRRSSDDCTDGNSSSCSSELDALNPAEQCLLEGLTDQLDATDAELEHLAQQLQQQQAAIAAADAAAAVLRSRVDGMSSRQLAKVLQQALDLLVEQSSSWQAAAHKVSSVRNLLCHAGRWLYESTLLQQALDLSVEQSGCWQAAARKVGLESQTAAACVKSQCCSRL